MKRRWALLTGVSYPFPNTLRISMDDVSKCDMRSMADELVSSGYATESFVSEKHIDFMDAEIMLKDIDAMLDMVKSLLDEYNYEILNLE